MSATSGIGHKLKIDQLVEYIPKAASKFSAPRGSYQITKLLPEHHGEFQYRIKARSNSASVWFLRANWGRFSWEIWLGVKSPAATQAGPSMSQMGT
jgi:hypothetical protein